VGPVASSIKHFREDYEALLKKNAEGTA